MAAIDDLIAQIEDKTLRERLQTEINQIAKGKKFGLVFENHLPELTPIYTARVRKHSKVALRAGPLTDLWRVLLIQDSEAHCWNLKSGETRPIPVADLVVVRQFGEPIFPALIPVDKVQNGPDDAPWHTLIEADNYHALQLLEYLYAGQVDCIYIDPPYNTGARDWKYNNDYVDGNDGWRHSKWLAFMEKRLKLAKRLLKPDTGVLIVTIDEHEVLHLGMLLEALFPEAYCQLVTIVVNPKGVTQGRFSRVEEYALFYFMKGAFVKGLQDDLLTPIESGKTSSKPRWKGLLRSGTNARRIDREKLFFPVLIDKDRHAIVGAGDYLPLPDVPDIDAKIDGFLAAWPIRSDGSWGNWGVGPASLRELIQKGYVSLGGYDKKRKTWGISYLSKKLQKQIETGAIQVIELDKQHNSVKVEYAEARERQIKTVWHRSNHDAGAYGSDILKAIFGGTGAFSFPKSLYAVRDSLSAIILERPNALIVDFFAGSGTTLNAVNLLNATDGGQRRCILVTNNEVSAEEAENLRSRGLQPGHADWEAQGICRSVTWPRSKFTLLGQRDDGTALPGDYLTGKTVEKEKPRNFKPISFIDPATLDTPAKKKQLVALIDSIPQSEVQKDSAFVVSEKHPASILFDESQADAWLEALEEQDHIIDFYIVTASKPVFDNLKARIQELLGPVVTTEEEKRPLRDGFPANLEYFRLDFLDKDQIALGRQFREILPLLWLRAGAIGPRPKLPQDQPIPAMLLPEHNPFAILVDEARFADMLTRLAGRDDLTHVYLVTDSEDAFQEMARQLRVPQVIQLYRDYLENFMINKGQDAP